VIKSCNVKKCGAGVTHVNKRSSSSITSQGSSFINSSLWDVLSFSQISEIAPMGQYAYRNVGQQKTKAGRWCQPSEILQPRGITSTQLGGSSINAQLIQEIELPNGPCHFLSMRAS